MQVFRLDLYDATRHEQYPDIERFVGTDASGSFAIWGGHTRLMTALAFGLCRFRGPDASWNHLALPGGLLYFRENRLSIMTRHFVVERDYERVTTILEEQLAQEEASLREIHGSLRRMEEEMLRRLWSLRRSGVNP